MESHDTGSSRDAEALIEAARLTAPRDAHAAAHLLTRALEFLAQDDPRRQEVVLELLPLAAWGGTPREAERLARAALAEVGSPHARRFKAHLATALGLQDRWNEACRVWTELLEGSSIGADDHWTIAGENAAALAFCRRLDDARDAAEAVLRNADQRDAVARYSALQAMCSCLFFEGRYKEATAAASEMVDLMGEAGDATLRWRNPHLIYGFMLSATGRNDEAKERLKMARDLAERTGALWAGPAYQWYLGNIYFREGDWDRASEEFGKGLVLCDATEGTWETASLLGNYAVLEARRGDFVSATRHVERLAVMDELNLADRAWAALARSLVAEGEGRNKDALVELMAIWTEADRDDVLQLMLGMLPDLIRLAVEAGDAALGATLVETIETARRRHPGSASIEGPAAHARGVVEANETFLEAAISSYESHQQELDEALAWEELALVWADKSRPRKAMAAVREALARFDRMGAQTDARRMRGRLRSRGAFAPPPSVDVPGDGAWATLTKTEKAVALLVAEGLRNKEIAARMFVSVQTVETHLKKVFRKLGAASRSQVVREVLRNTERPIEAQSTQDLR